MKISRHDGCTFSSVNQHFILVNHGKNEKVEASIEHFITNMIVYTVFVLFRFILLGYFLLEKIVKISR